ncbi:MAG: tetratricopeptide repeat protein [Candidatus Brocadiaceae bacterium]|nr:tetratricopeptide repeat protein [Candidatus Brocadiaceae bacterium]
MIKKLQQKINTLIGATSGYRGVILINFCILVLVLGLMFVQYNWISKEKKALESMVDRQIDDEKGRKSRHQNTSNKLAKKTIDDKKRVVVSNNFSENTKVTKYNIKNTIKKADMYFDYEQYNKAVGVYEKVMGSKIAIDESDRVISRLAESYYKLARYDKALVLYRNVSNNYLNSPYKLRAQLGLGECLIVTGDYSGARRVLYSIAGQEAKYTENRDKQIVIEAHYKVADSYIEQAEHYLKKDAALQKIAVVR